ncbi:phospholipase A [Halomonas huangheensis]|uniref:Phospholipase A1 n=1 Tax=Halomonas huangheensis TaxID=1178482 RepID=W1N6K6_9GAMM|nr:phospholipase A [Halomonas huangheensis]ALM52023.1 phospholipase [Halomonas huangheensis]ERL50575.1 hypothetical protein BJB45_05455 [Halomonas huangheensis]
MMKRPAALGLLATPLLALGIIGQVNAQSTLSPSEREAMEARVQELQSELAKLQSQLGESPATTSTALSSNSASSSSDVSVSNELVTNGTIAAVAESGADELAQERRQLEEESESNPFAITTHHRNYILPISYNQKPNEASFVGEEGREMDNTEVKFQFSAKFNIAEDLLFDNGDVFFAYTQRSWWQAYNGEESAPFRETNYEPEVFVDFQNDYELWGWTNIGNRVAFNHQSNGRSGELSRSWNRVILTSTWVNDDWAFVATPHWRVPEDDNSDDNPDIEEYVGYADFTIAHQLFKNHEASLLLRGNPDDGHYGGQLDYSWPLFGKVRGHVQYYNGYGESLIDYNAKTNRLGIGFSLNPLFPSGSGSTDSSSITSSY